ncbi:MAG TPA: serine/threonine-protein kinase [Polyangiaceae bacterium]|nr:serine/threonine-protein kinase [Polyangiaceae bacterium]
MAPGIPPVARGTVRQGGKEELRASVLKTYLLRLRTEKGERAVLQLLAAAGIDPSIVDNETGWVSRLAARRALRAIAHQLGREAIRLRGDWATHPEALGVLVRMLRSSERPLDAYQYLAQNAREATRVGTWSIENQGEHRKGGGYVGRVRMTYRSLGGTGADDSAERSDSEGEELLCDARAAELASVPRIWGLAEAEVVHGSCITKGAEACVYDVRWTTQRSREGLLVGALGAGVACGGMVAAAGGPLAGAVAGVLGVVLGGGAGFMWDRSREERASRVFERNRIAALERGLELRGELGATPGDLTGTVLGGKYRIGRKIGSGGIGVVYAAEHVTLGHEVAVKVLRGAAARDGGEIARLRREAYIQVHVEHPNVVRVLDLDQMADGSIYVIMERLLGRSLADKLARDGLLAPGYAVPVFIDVCRALHAAHKKGVVHRDLKPGNIFLCEDGLAKVLDFGMSKLASAESLTQAGYTLGTPEYMAPEQCIGAQVEPRTDIYALGVMMYEALTGELPIIAQHRRELLDLHQRQIPIPMRHRRPDLPIPEALDLAIIKCLKKRLNERPKSAADLEQLLAAVPIEKLPTSYPPGTNRRAVSNIGRFDDTMAVPGPGAPPQEPEH